MQKHRSVWFLAAVGLVFCIAPMSLPLAATAAEKTIHVFAGGNDGENPYAGLISDSAGNAYGTTAVGGGGCSDGGCGTVFKLTKDRKESVLYAFKGGSDGDGPLGALMLGAAGNFYGTTVSGGGTGCGGYGCGTVFELAPDGTETVLYAFQGGNDGFQPGSNIVMDGSGNLFGTTVGGGTYNSDCAEGCGTVFEVQPDGTKNTFYMFQGGTDGQGPDGSLITDTAGNLYGTTGAGGGCSLYPSGGCGTVFELTPSGQETILYAFQGGTDGLGPVGGVIMDNAGNLYGATEFGGNSDCCGVVFAIPAGGGSESVLYSFRGGSDGANPLAGVVMDAHGNLYGTTEVGGGTGKGCKKVLFGNGCGTVFKLTPGGQETVLYSFEKKSGQLPEAPVMLGKNGTLFGTTTVGGAHNDGVVFEVKTK